jgi:hypothetical protein
MKRLKIIIFSIICVFLAVFSIHGGGAANDENIQLSGLRVDTASLEWGFKFATAIPVKPHIVDRSKAQYSILKSYIDIDKPETAIRLAEKIDDWRRCLIYADLAYYFAENNSKEKAELCLKRAGECENLLEGHNAGWQKDRTLKRMAEVQVITGQWDSIDESGTELSTESAESTKAMMYGRLSGPESYSKSMDQLRALETSEHLEVKRDVALSYISILNQLGKDASDDQCDTLKTRVASVTDMLPLLVKHDILCKLSRTAFETGHWDTGRDVFDEALENLNKREKNARYDVPSLSELARIWRRAGGEPERSESLLREAEALLKKSSLKSTDLARTMSSLALGFGIQGDEEKAWTCFSKALQAAASQVNARPRAMAVTAICNDMAQSGMELTGTINTELANMYETLGSPW